jgi:hypothetical protein
MIHEDITTAWVYEHYLIYLYLSIADCDCLISDKELENIKNHAVKSIDEERCNRLIKEVYLEFRAHSPQERRNYIKDNVFKYLRTESIRNKVIEDLNTITNKDEESEEYIMFRYIRKVINIAK